MNPTLLKDLILAGHRVACKTHEWNWKVFLFINWNWEFEWTVSRNLIEKCFFAWLSETSYTEWEIASILTWEYKIVTPLPQLPQVWDTVEVLEICREIAMSGVMKDMIWKKYIVKESNNRHVLLNEFYFSPRMVAKC